MKRLIAIAVTLAALGLASVALAAGPSGTYRTKITSSALGGGVKGTWTISFARGTYTVRENGSLIVRGRYATKGSEILLQDTSGSDACEGKNTGGIYKFAIHGKSLKLTKVSDRSSCAKGRVIVLTSHALTRIS